MTNLRKKNFDFRSKVIQLEEKSKKKPDEVDSMASMQMAMQLHQ